MGDLNVNAKRQVLLTGAGFTHNFGGPLAGGMWCEIFNSNHLRPHKRILELLRTNEDFDFECVYDKVVNGDFTDSEKTGYGLAIQQAYEDLDITIRNSQHGPGSAHPVDLPRVRDFISKFAGTAKEPGFIFTLNQDLFLERRYYPPARNCTGLVLPGLRPPHNVRWFESSFTQGISPDTTATVPCESEIPEKVSEDIKTHSFCYVKLHGSYGWRRVDGTVPFVIGRHKVDAISADPLLKLYFEIFERVLDQKNRRLLVIGYGFCDDHVNVAIERGVKEHGLEVYILNPTNPKNFKNSLKSRRCSCEGIWEGIYGYYPYTLRQLFPESQEPKQTKTAMQLCETLFR